MESLYILTFVCAIQTTVYFILDSLRLSKWKYLALAILLVSEFIILPWYFMPDNEGEPQCGMPQVAITLFFGMLGIITLATHLTYVLFKHLLNTVRKTKTKDDYQSE